MTTQIVPRRAGPSWRTLSLLAALVLLAHALVLRTQPARFGPAKDQEALRVAVLTTRSIPAAPPVSANPSAKPVKPAKKPVYKKKVPIAHVQRAQVATKKIANICFNQFMSPS